MRNIISRSARVKKGDLIRITCRLSKDMDLARLYVWSAVGEHAFSPHVQMLSDMVVVGNKPTFMKPVSIRLDEFHKQKTITFISEENQSICVMQEKDLSSEINAKARIIVYGKAAQNIRRLLRNALGFVRRIYESSIWANR